MQHAVGAHALWHLRILAGWVPPKGVSIIRALAGWFEIANVEAMAASTNQTVELAARYELGRLSVIGHGARHARTLVELRKAVAASQWRDPGGETVESLLIGMRLGWAGLIRQAATDRREWGSGLAAMILAQDLFLPGAAHRNASVRRAQGIGSGWQNTTDLASYIAALPAAAAWVFADVQGVEELWRAEDTWWERIAADGADLLLTSQLGRGTVTGAAAVIVADARGTQVSLSRSARAGAHGRDHALI
jgi:hypothetical protein